ncbi:MAG: hypothetical protein ABI183_14030 [Polyangiaceae bacterium]
MSTDQGCNEQAAAICKKINDCSPFLLQSEYGDETTCSGQQKQACLALLQADGTSRTAGGASECASALRAQSCTDYAADTPLPACAAQPGSLTGGKPCIDDSQCTSAYCRVTSTSAGACGLCANNPAAQLGATCSGSTPCDVGLTCVGGEGGTICAGLGQSGNACSADAPCAAGLICQTATSIGDGGFTTTSGTCTALGSQGTTCSATLLCDPTQGLACDPASKQCSAVTLAPSDQICDNDLTLCSAGTCRASPEAGPEAGPDDPRICIPSSTVGGECDVNAGPDCMPPAQCTQHVCTLKQASSCH